MHILFLHGDLLSAGEHMLLQRRQTSFCNGFRKEALRNYFVCQLDPHVKWLLFSAARALNGLPWDVSFLATRSSMRACPLQAGT